VLIFLSGCGSKLPKLTPVQEAEIKKYIDEHGGEALLYYLKEKGGKGADEKLVLTYCIHFVSKGADVNAKHYNGTTPLLWLAGSEKVDVIKFLVTQGADVNAKDQDGNTPLHRQVNWNENVEVVKLLVSKGADVNAKNKHGETPLHNAVTGSEKIEVVKFLVSKGADVNAKCRYYDDPIAERLTHDPPQWGYTPTPLDLTPLDLAKHWGNTEVVKYLSGAVSKSGK